MGPVPRDSQDPDAVTVKFRQSRGGPVVTALIADASLDDISTAYPWRTFRWYKQQKHYSGGIGQRRKCLQWYTNHG
jgi:hypothetical protein